MLTDGPAAADVALVRLAADEIGELAELFERNDLAPVTRHFDPFPLTAASARALLEQPRSDRFYGARLQGRLIGFSMLRGWDEGYEVPSLGLLVDSEHQGIGIGRRLAMHACEEALALGCPRVRLSVRPGNERAMRLYRSLGFEARERTGERVVMDLGLLPPPVPVAAPALDGNELAYVRDCLKSTYISSVGPYVERFEREFAAFCDTRHAVACCNGSAALHLALLAAGVGPGDEVIVPALTYVACANAVVACGARPVLADAEPRTWNVDPDAVAAALTARTRAILAVHLYGNPADMDALRALAEANDLALVEDAAEAHGASDRGRPAGSLGDVATFSFFGNKALTTGEGGMVVTSDETIADRARLLRGQGQEPGRHYWHTERGFNYRMTNVAAAIGVAQLERAPVHLARRAQVAGWYREALAPLPGVELAEEPEHARSGCWMVAVRLAATPVDRTTVARRLAERGIETRPAFHPLHRLPIYAEAAGGGRYPVADDLGARVLCLPTSSTFERPTVDRVVLALEHALR